MSRGGGRGGRVSECSMWESWVPVYFTQPTEARF
jgi:hypothetical protein